MTEPGSAADAPDVDQQPVAEVLPGLYRSVLDAVADLERRGLRREAAGIRVEATRLYSGTWNAPTAHRMRVLTARAARIVASRRPRRRSSIMSTLGRRPTAGRTTL